MSLPRNILLINEFENAMKGLYGEVSFGIVNDDITLTKWNGSIITRRGDIFEFSFDCDENFPLYPPNIFFKERDLNNKCLASICENNGSIKDCFKKTLDWSKNTSLGEYFINIKKIIDNKY